MSTRSAAGSRAGTRIGRRPLLDVLAVTAAIAWLGLGMLFGWRSLAWEVDRFARLSLPGETHVQLTRSGGYVLYLEGPATGLLTGPAFTASLRPAGGGAEIPVQNYGAAVGYDFGGHRGYAVGTFAVDRPGTYVLRAERFTEGPPANFAVGRGLQPSIVRALAVAFTGPVIVLVAGAGRAFRAVVRARRRRAGQPATPYPPTASDQSTEELE